jgi:glycerol-3-phosphate acyltransferase PlsY
VLSVVAIIISYLLGSITFSFVVGKLFKGVDVRKHGSGNAGATNTLRVLGVGPAVLVLALDIAKGVAAVVIGYEFANADQLWIPVACGISVIVGHNWPVFFGFKGGKGIATTIGVLATLSFLPTLYAGLIAIAVIVITRYVSLGSLFLTLLTPIFLLALGYSMEIFWASLVILVLASYRHRSNIKKLLQGTENKIGSGKNKD